MSPMIIVIILDMIGWVTPKISFTRGLVLICQNIYLMIPSSENGYVGDCDSCLLTYQRGQTLLLSIPMIVFFINAAH